MVGGLGQRHVRRSLDQGEELRSMTSIRAERPVSALRCRVTGAGASPRADQLDRGRRRHAIGSRPMLGRRYRFRCPSHQIPLIESACGLPSDGWTLTRYDL